jgi:hypothetical protein
MARAQVPSVISHVGFVEVNGIPYHGEGRFKFALVSGATSLWSHDGTSEAGSEPTSWVSTNLFHGRYSMPLGDTSVANMTVPIPPSALSANNVLLRVWFNDGSLGFQLLTPDQPLVSVPYALRAASLADDSVGSQQLAANAVQSADIADGAVTSAKILNSTIVSADLADGAVTSAKILNSTIVSADIADGTITGADLLDGTVASADIQDGALTLTDFNLANVDVRYVLKAGDTISGNLGVLGNVGIGSGAAVLPFTTLTVDGTLGFSTVASPAMYVYPSGTGNPEKRLIMHSPAFSEYGLYYSDPGDQFVMKSSAGDTTPSLVVDLDNNWVAIATATPKPGYELSVDGKIVCEELLVEDSADWPDYVFQADYRLQPLEEVEAHIKERKHLPGIPTAAEISKNGLPIGEMQKRMMEKIEELTLHLIEQNKRMTTQDERIRQLEAELRQRTGATMVEGVR